MGRMDGQTDGKTDGQTGRTGVILHVNALLLFFEQAGA